MGISGDGTRIVGKATYNAVEQPVYWLAGKINRLPYVSDSLISGSAIDASSDAGIIVGYGSSWVDAKYYGAPRRAYLWKRGGLNYTAYELPTYIAGRASNSRYASAVSSLGETIGGAVFDSIAGRGVSVWPVIWRQAPSGGSSFELVPLAGTVGEDAVGEVLDISEDGRIAVGSLGTYPNAKPCWWWVASPSAPPISAHAIPLPAGDFSGIATCTNRTGTAIFGARMAEPSPGDTVFNGFMFDGVGMTTADLRQYLDSPPGAIPAGFDLGQIMGTAADEQGYVGAGFNGTWSEGWVVRCKTVYHPWWRHVIHYVFGPPKPSSAKPPH